MIGNIAALRARGRPVRLYGWGTTDFCLDGVLSPEGLDASDLSAGAPGILGRGPPLVGPRDPGPCTRPGAPILSGEDTPPTSREQLMTGRPAIKPTFESRLVHTGPLTSPLTDPVRST